ncbi:MAG: 1-deoxy-D-xylulose-5-phosphate synthase [Gemmatimonadetes bacterium]|nr:1-deoxy-D-xylulose-5-phosphate synthase [Gemmatimonadota bacterium]
MGPDRRRGSGSSRRSRLWQRAGSNPLRWRPWPATWFIAIGSGAPRVGFHYFSAPSLEADPRSTGRKKLSLLERVRDPSDLRTLSRTELEMLVVELRDRHIDVVSQVGGHFGASLGVAELTVALHYVFDTPRDRLVWDTGHQAYLHKILTGRNDRFPTIRHDGGLAPFLSRDESEYDTFGAGHAATSISAALGMATARDLLGRDEKVVAIIGDGAMGCGLAYEALNNAGHTDTNLTVVLNDNEMSIAPNVGAMSKYLTTMITNPVYNRVRDEVKALIQRAPRSLGGIIESVAVKVEESVKHMLVPGMLFQELGFRYVGPVDGHNLPGLLDAFEGVRQMKGPILVHVLTQKGRGYGPAEKDPMKWHAASPFEKISGSGKSKAGGLPRYQKVFGVGLTELGRHDPRIVVITAGMPDGTSSEIFGAAFPERHFDVGIAEAHGTTFAAGLATQGIRPVVAIYSTFLQRAYDSIIHDVALQRLPVVFCMDRAGVAGEDGPTHHGAFDINYMLAVPGVTVTAPKDGSEMLALLRLALALDDGPFSIRWPRAAVPSEVPSISEIPELPYGTWEVLREGSQVAILAVGAMVQPAVEAAALLERKGVTATVVNCRFMRPYDRAILSRVLADHDAVLTVEEGARTNGFGAFLAREIADDPDLRFPSRFGTMGLPDQFMEHGPREILLSRVGLDAAGIAKRASELAGEGIRVSRESA